MAFDGIVVANLAYELKEKLINGRISKIAQPETDELLLTVKSASGQYRLLISADASLLGRLRKNNITQYNMKIKQAILHSSSIFNRINFKKGRK